MLAAIPSELLKGLRLTVVIFIATGLIYPLFVTGVGQAIFPGQAGGSLIMRNGQVVGSSLIGQYFTSARYFHGRPSATVNPVTGKPEPYAADNSAGSTYGPTNPALIARVKAAVAEIRNENHLGPNTPIPVDLVTTDFTGFDPNVTEASALLQVDRVAQARGLDPARVRAMVEKYQQGRILWLFGEPHVNVLQLNLALDNGEAG